VIGQLRAAGHETLTGDGERAHLRRPDISLRTHIDDLTLRHLVYVDATVPLPGEGWGQGHPPEIVRGRSRAGRAAATRCRAPSLPPGVPGDAERWARVPRTFVDCNQPAYLTIDTMRRRVRQQPGWNIVEIPIGHCPMVSAPQVLVRHLLALA
jgi:hypothetical protein